MPTKEFIQARKQGEVAQRYVAGMFRSWNLSVVETPRGYRPGYDQIISGSLRSLPIRAKVEVKWDKKCSESGNIYLDISSLQKSEASMLVICLNNPIDTALMLPLKDALNYATRHANINGGEYMERSACVPKDQFIADLKPQILTTKG